MEEIGYGIPSTSTEILSYFKMKISRYSMELWKK